MDNEEQQKESFKWFLQNVKELSKNYPEKFIAIKDCNVLGAYDTFVIALTETQRQGHEIGSFLVQQASEDPSAYTMTLYNSFVGVV